MGYIKDFYGDRSNDFIAGFLAAIDTYAVYQNGKRYIGSPEKEAKAEMKRVCAELGNPDFMEESKDIY